MAFNPQIWSAETAKKMKQTLEKTKRLSNSVIDYTKFTKGIKAEGYNGPYLGDVSAIDMPISEENFNELGRNNIQFLFDQQKGVPIAISDINSAQHILNERAEYTEKAKNALLDVYDDFIARGLITMTLESNRVTKSDKTSNKITSEDFRRARKALNKANAPLRDRYAYVNADDEGDLSAIPEFISNDKLPQGTVIKEGMVGRAFGFDVILYSAMPMVNSNGLIDAAAENNTQKINLFFQKNAYGWGRQKEFGVKVEPKAGSASDWLNTYSVFGGVKHKDSFVYTVRDNVII